MRLSLSAVPNSVRQVLFETHPFLLMDESLYWCALAQRLQGQTAEPTTRERLKLFIGRVKVVDVHEHIGLKSSSLMGSRYENIGRMCSATNENFYSILSGDYLPADLISAGSPSIPVDRVLDGNLRSLWQPTGDIWI